MLICRPDAGPRIRSGVSGMTTIDRLYLLVFEDQSQLVQGIPRSRKAGVGGHLEDGLEYLFDFRTVVQRHLQVESEGIDPAEGSQDADAAERSGFEIDAPAGPYPSPYHGHHFSLEVGADGLEPREELLYVFLADHLGELPVTLFVIVVHSDLQKWDPRGRPRGSLGDVD